MAVHYYPEVPKGTPIDDFMKGLTRGVIQGTAFAVAADTFVTCYHVTKDLTPKRLRLTGAPDYTAGLSVNEYAVVETKEDPELDITLLKAERVKGEAIPIPLQVGVPQVGLDVLAVGYPLPEQSAPELIEKQHINVNVVLTFRTMRGIIASRLADTIHFEIDKLANPGQSGGPIVSIENERAVGMCQAYKYLPQQGVKVPTDLSVCLNADVIHKKLNDWGVQVQ